MSKRPRRNHAPSFKAKVTLEAMKALPTLEQQKEIAQKEAKAQ